MNFRHLGIVVRGVLNPVTILLIITTRNASDVTLILVESPGGGNIYKHGKCESGVKFIFHFVH